MSGAVFKIRLSITADTLDLRQQTPVLQVHPTLLLRPRQTPGSRPSDPERDPASESSRAALKAAAPCAHTETYLPTVLGKTSMKREKKRCHDGAGPIGRRHRSSRQAWLKPRSLASPEQTDQDQEGAQHGFAARTLEPLLLVHTRQSLTNKQSPCFLQGLPGMARPSLPDPRTTGGTDSH